MNALAWGAPWHVSVHAWPAGAVYHRPSCVFGQNLTVVQVTPEQLGQPLARSFDEVLDQLATLPRLFIEPDGSFVWVGCGDGGEDGWQIDGQLHEGATGLMTIELKLAGRRPDWRSVLHCAGWPAQRVLFHLVQLGLFLDDSAWQSLCSAACGPDAAPQRAVDESPESP